MKTYYPYQVPAVGLYSFKFSGRALCVSFGDPGHAGTDPTEEETHDL